MCFDDRIFFRNRLYESDFFFDDLIAIIYKWSIISILKFFKDVVLW